jgi:esterase
MLCNAQITAQGNDLPWAVLIHGLFGSGDNLNILARALAPHCNVIQIDLPDHGQSPWNDGFSFAHYCTMIVATLAHHNITSAHFIGHSLGGKMSMHIALTHPELVTTLCVADIAPVNYPHRHQAVLYALNHVDLSKFIQRSEVKAQFDELLEEEGTKQFLLKSLYKDNTGTWRWRFNHQLLTRDYELLIAWPEFTTQYQGPTLFIKGQDSDYITREHQSDILQLFPYATSKIIAGTGHWLHAQKPLAFNRIVEQFILKHLI